MLKDRFLCLFLSAFFILGSTSIANAFILEGDFLRVGVSQSGGLIDPGGNTGITYDPTGNSNFPTGDFLLPGTPWEGWSLGVDGSIASQSYYQSRNDIGGTTVNTSGVGVLSARTRGSFNGLDVLQDMAFFENGAIIQFQVTLTNTLDSDLMDIVYSRGLDPDQDVFFPGGGFSTDNEIVNGNLVTASAPISDWTIGIFSNSSFAHNPSVNSSWPQRDPYALLTAGFAGDGDYSIDMAWDIGTLGPSESALLEFEYRIGENRGTVIVPPGDPIPEPSTFILLGAGLLGLIAMGRKRIMNS